MSARWEGMGAVWLQMALERFLESRPYYPCCLLVSKDVAVLTQAALEVQRLLAWPVISIDDTVCEPLLTVPVAARSAQVYGLLDTALRGYAPGPVLFTNTDVLFEPSLRLDPLLLFQRASRLLPLVVTWAGSFEHGLLNYAVPEHAHTRPWRTPDLCADCVICLDS